MESETFRSFVEVTKFVVGIVVTGCCTHLLFTRREANSRCQKARDQFRAVLASQRAKLDVIDRQKPDEARWRKEKEFYLESVEALITAIHQIRPFVTRREGLCLDTVLAGYQAHKEQYVGLTRHGMDAHTGMTYAQRMHAYLDKFDTAIPK